MNAESKARHRADSAPKPPRHRSEDLTDPANTGPLQIVARQHAHVAPPSGRRKAVAVASGGLLLTGLTGHAAATGQQPPPTGMNRTVTDTDLMGLAQASPDALVPFAKVKVESKAAPPAPAPRPAPKPPVFTHKPAPAAAPAPAPAPVQPRAPRHAAAPAPARPAPAPAPRPVPPASKGALIAATALAQLGQYQDCTRLATRSLAAVGINFHGWPAGYLSLGPQVRAAQAMPGDLIYYANGGMGLAHIAVYIGGGMAVHGGWNGNTTVKFTANVGSGPVFIRVI